MLMEHQDRDECACQPCKGERFLLVVAAWPGWRQHMRRAKRRRVASGREVG